MGKSQRTKGASYEREVCDAFTAALGLEKKITRNIGQARDGGNDIDIGPLVVECKRRKTLGTVYSWLQQAIVAASDSDDSSPYVTDGQIDPSIPVVVARQDQGESIVILRFDDFITLAGDKIKASL